METKKVVVIGAGVVGSAIARVLSKYQNLEVFLLEKNIDVGWGSSKANSAVIHPGHEDDPSKYPLRSKLCVRGNRLWHSWAEELDVPVKWPGELMLAFSERDVEKFQYYLDLAEKNGVPDVKIVYSDELRELEPNASPDAIAGLWAPTAGLIAPWDAVLGLVENAVDNGVKLFTETEVEDIVIENGIVKGVQTNRGFFEADIVINAAGLYADIISKKAGIDFDITPRRGEYYLLEEDVQPRVKRIVHQVPTEITKGVFISETVEGNILIGPSAENLPLDAKDDVSTTKKYLDYIWESAKRLLAKMPPKSSVIKTFAGLRAEPPSGRWIIEAYDNPKGFINAAGMRSPALTSSPAIAEYIVNELIKNKLGVKLVEKKDWNPYRKGIKKFKLLDDRKKEELIKENPKFGNVLCMCKEVTEAEIIEAIERMKKIGIKTISLDGIKFRTTSMFGWCQGSFCRVRIARVAANYLGMPEWKIFVKDNKSSYGVGYVKTFFKTSQGDGEV
ncbi:MAG: glycerol-3-phosphate dehydrogenase [Thermosipho sp. (in: thermotogales)]|nr:glycerol-3-phosphate dehydrogenase [Thermosipho sp. (in: thermotogales)]